MADRRVIVGASAQKNVRRGSKLSRRHPSVRRVPSACCSLLGSRCINKSSGPNHTEILTPPAGVFEAMAFGPPLATPEEPGRGQADETEQEKKPKPARKTGRVLGSGTRLVGEPAR